MLSEEKAPSQQADTGRLIALAERFADEGQMNLNKLLEAAVYAQARRAAWSHRPKITAATMVQELRACVNALEQDGAAPELVEGLERGLNALESGRGGDMLAEEAPDVFVCRACGHTALGGTPDRCPQCGAWRGRFRKFVATYSSDNMEPLNPANVLDLLEKNANDLAQLVHGLREEALAQKPAQDAWSIREHILHWAITQDLLETRLALILNEDNPDLSGVSAYELEQEEKRIQAGTTREMLDEFVTRRQQTVAQLRALPLQELYRQGRHSEFGEITAVRQAAYFAFHEQTHLPEIENLCGRWQESEQ